MNFFLQIPKMLTEIKNHKIITNIFITLNGLSPEIFKIEILKRKIDPAEILYHR